MSEESTLTTQEQQALKESRLIWQMVDSEGYREVFKPFLEAKLRESFPDPVKFTKEEEFVYAAKVTSVFKKVVGELLGWFEAHIDQAKKLEQKEKGLQDPFEIGRE